MRSHFNVFSGRSCSWAALVMGAMTSTSNSVEEMFHRRHAVLTAAIAFFLFFLVFRVSWTFNVLPEVVWNRFVAVTNRGEFSLVYLLNFMAAGYILAWLMIEH